MWPRRSGIAAREQGTGTQAEWQRGGKRAATQGAEESSAPQARRI
ncbi:MAG TPA: hypothetical protein VJQ84_03990 [Solirubrobacterales bacterium]|nr:hypothetical protein [Solirubrobacterales bacterium]